MIFLQEVQTKTILNLQQLRSDTSRLQQLVFIFHRMIVSFFFFFFLCQFAVVSMSLFFVTSFQVGRSVVFIPVVKHWFVKSSSTSPSRSRWVQKPLTHL